MNVLPPDILEELIGVSLSEAIHDLLPSGPATEECELAARRYVAGRFGTDVFTRVDFEAAIAPFAKEHAFEFSNCVEATTTRMIQRFGAIQ